MMSTPQSSATQPHTDNQRLTNALLGFAGRAAQSSDPKMREAAKNLKAELRALQQTK